MSPKAASTARRSTAPGKKKKDAVEIIVRRGALRRFDALKTKTGELPVNLTWDRRLSDRRDGDAAAAKPERRYKDRRRTPPFTWDVADFVVVEPTKRQKTTRKKPSKKS